MQDLNETAHKILDVAEYYTQTRGLNAFSYKDIQNEVGVKTSSIHYYFPTKQDLVFTMTQRYVENFHMLLKDIEENNKTGLEQLEELGNLYVDTLRLGKFCMCGMLASDTLSLPDNVNEKLNEFFDLLAKWISAAIELGKEKGDFAVSVNTTVTASHFLATLEGGMLIARAQKRVDYLKAIVEEALNQLKN